MKKQSAAEFYDQRLRELGVVVDSVGWSSRESQYLRFELLRDDIDLKGKSVLDLGCGLGDLADYLNAVTEGDFEYVGVDISGQFIKLCREKFKGINIQFIEGEISNLKVNQVDFTFASGVFTYETGENEDYCRQTIKHIFDMSRIGCSFNFLSTQADHYLEKNHHYSPMVILETALELTPKIKLIHGRPKHEFTVILRK
jgi:SAM-dependent methyltransferase